jgi:glycosyltransferase involved in cell wall biosynthesis
MYPTMQVAFSWNGLPQYAARLIRGALDRVGENCIVVGSKPSVPVLGMEEALKSPVHWLDASQATNWQALGCEVPNIFVQSGWAYPAFSSLGREVKERGGRVIGLSDANWRGDFRQVVLGALAFRALHRRHFDAMIVPGRQGKRLMRWFGMPTDRVRGGMCGADPALFGAGDSLPLRPRTFLFVGQFIARKNVVGLANAFMRFSRSRPEWTLRLCGSGEQRDLIPRDGRIIVEDFVQPAQLAERYRQARFFVLPSLFEAWGLVVHEASLSGCALVLSDCIGSADDLATPRNGVRFRAGSDDDLVRALHEAADFDDARLLEAGMESRRLAREFGPERFGREVADLIDRFADEANRGTR